MMENRLLVPTRGSSGMEVGRPSLRPESPGHHDHRVTGAASDRSGQSSFETMLHSAEKRFRDSGADSRDDTVQGSGKQDRNRSAENRIGQKEATSKSDGECENLVNAGESGVETGREDSGGKVDGEGRDSGKRAGSELEERGHHWRFHREWPAEGDAAWRAGEGEAVSSQSEDDSTSGNLSPDGVGQKGDRSVADGSGFVADEAKADGESVSPSVDPRSGFSQSVGDVEAGLKGAGAEVPAEETDSGRLGKIATQGGQAVPEAGPDEGEAGEKIAGSSLHEGSAEKRLSNVSVERHVVQTATSERMDRRRDLLAVRAGQGEGDRGPGSEGTAEEIRTERWNSLIPSDERMAAEGAAPAEDGGVSRPAAGRWRGSRGDARRVRGEKAPLDNATGGSFTEGRNFSGLAGTGDRSTGTGTSLSSENRVSVPSFWSFGESGMESDEPVQTDLEDDGFDWRTFVAEIREMEEERKDTAAVSMSRLAQLPVANFSLRQHLLPGLTQQVLEAAAGRTAGGGWQKQSVVLDDGHRIQLATRRVDGVLQVKISSVDTELNRLLIQHQQEIREHFEKKCDLKLDLQFEQENFEETSSDGDAETGFAGLSYGSDVKGSRLSGRDRKKTIEKSVEKLTPVSVRSFGYNRMEWTA